MKPIYVPKGKALEYADYALNIYTGCNHGCTYCWARKMHERFHPETRFDDVQPRPGLLDALNAQLTTGAYKGKLIHLCFSCDPYPAPPVDTTITRECIKAIKAAGAHVQILTKGGMRAERDYDLLDGDDWFGATISGGMFSQITCEPNAADFFDRTKSLGVAHDRGIKTWVSCEPVINHLVIYGLIKEFVFAKDIDRYAVGKLNYAPSDIDWGAFGRECERLAKEYGRNVYIKADLRKEMERAK
jgi:DNA repair photolyase